MGQTESETTALTLPVGERHVLRVFTLALPGAEIAALRGDADLLAALLGVDMLDPAGVEVFDLADLEGVGLAAYLTQGNGVAEAQIAADRARLSALRGPVLILHASAFDGRATTLHPDPRLRFVGRYGEELPPPVQFEPLPDAAARGLLPQGKPVMSDARMSGMVATVVLLFLAIFTVIFVVMS